MVAALLVGLLNAVSVTVFRINALITTLATLAILRGLTKVASDGQTVSLPGFQWLGTARIVGLPIPVYIFAGMVAIFFFVLRYTTYGRSMYAIGASPTAARLAGIRTDRAIFIAFVLSAALAGLSGLILVSQVGSASPNAGIGLELSVVTAVVLGGASLSGGRGSIVGTTWPCSSSGCWATGSSSLAVPSFWIDVAGGLLLLVAVGFDQVRVRFSVADAADFHEHRAGHRTSRKEDIVTEVDRSIPFIETHHHLWELDRFHYDWLTDPGWPGHNELLGDYKMIRSTIGAPWRFFKEFYGANVIKSVHVEAAYAGPDALEETVWLDAVGKEHGFPHALVVFCDIEADGAEAKLDQHLAASDRVRGVRIRAHPDDPDTAAFRNGYAALGKRGLSYELNASPGKLLSGRDVAKAYPDIQVILGHAGFPVQRDDEYFGQWKSEMTALGEAENVACKVSGFGMADNHWTIDSIRPWVLHCIEAFGPERIMFGTNWPVDILYATYLEQTDAYRRIIAEAGFSREEQEAMLYRNAERFYRI